ncbi:CopG family transcriptional regulator [Acidianus manzaensis]|uniref:CopG family transcriptional regulator n=1 Tax=Acidianus manzaensis TaxID=282676 RepID=A0A1W6K0D6_9CREN|nr:CopG family transcriptional regulator [Acidianus manzaensis]ARM75979.1 CopG family transcriptional regulator [Acidianus manzaensis]
MKTIIIKLTDDEYKQLEEEAKKEGYVLLSSYVKFKLLSSNSLPESNVSNANTDDIVRKIERKVQDMVNPFTAEVDNLKRKVAELSEKLDSLTEMQKENLEKAKTEVKPKKFGNAQQQQGHKKTVMEILKEQGVIYESEIKLKNPDLFFEKIEKEGGKVLYTEKERIAVDQEFYSNFVKKLTDIHTSDDVEAQKFLNKQEHKLFQKLRSLGIIYFDTNTKSWKISGL